jgi:hypothetical protein
MKEVPLARTSDLVLNGIQIEGARFSVSARSNSATPELLQLLTPDFRLLPLNVLRLAYTALGPVLHNPHSGELVCCWNAAL